MPFKVEDIPDLTNKVAIVTGANTGLGKVSAIELARKGAHVILACRSADKTLPVVEEIKQETKNDKVEFMKLDLSSLKSVEEFSDAFHARNLPLNLLMNNAGIMMSPYQLTADGIESQFATNHVGHFYLTQLLFDVLERSQPSRIVIVSSSLHSSSYSRGVRFDKINDEKSYSDTSAYGQSKLCNVLFARELARRCEGKQIYVNSCHPGVVRTDLQRHWSGVARFFFGLANRIVGTPMMEGVSPQLYLGTHPDVEKNRIVGQYYGPVAKRETVSRQGRDSELGERLWAFTEDLLRSKVKYQSRI